MTDAFIETPAERTTDRTQVFAAVLLGIAATLTAFSAYNAALKDGEALQGYTKSTRTLSDANGFYTDGNQVYALDQQLFVSYVGATQDPEGQVLAEYLKEIMRPELVAAIEWWEPEENTAATPFVDEDGNPYVVEEYDEADATKQRAEEEFAAATDADDVGDSYELAAVFFALTLFFGGVATLFARRAVTYALLVAGVLALVVGSGALFAV